ncbi:CAP family protein [Nocardiopsis sp. RSe5-2]|uniref:CAP family protein n=1 Tax=Nocardiopsis endophytica TaxID=3018445 RepID=A0ABT4TX59_9ACTN|nr:CAP family protein [Nocardiopsis endophytica]MDA2809281.1 CAP family protein [Nocardiopsis endophytica]
MRSRLLPLFPIAAMAVLLGPVAPSADAADGLGPVRPAFPDSTDDVFLSEAVEAANAHRARHGAPPLELDGELNAHALKRAREFSEYEGLEEGSRGREPGRGETVYRSASTDPGAVPGGGDAVDHWYAGSGGYDYGDPGFSPGTGAFTQLVWKATTKVGAARVSEPASPQDTWREHYVVLVYTPPGNMQGEYGENVLPPEG